MACQRAGNMLDVQAAWDPSVVIKSGKCCVNQSCRVAYRYMKDFFNMPWVHIAINLCVHWILSWGYKYSTSLGRSSYWRVGDILKTLLKWNVSLGAQITRSSLFTHKWQHSCFHLLCNFSPIQITLVHPQWDQATPMKESRRWIVLLWYRLPPVTLNIGCCLCHDFLLSLSRIRTQFRLTPASSHL